MLRQVCAGCRRFPAAAYVPLARLLAVLPAHARRWPWVGALDSLPDPPPTEPLDRARLTALPAGP